MTIKDYFNSKHEFFPLPYNTVYSVIIALVKDGYIDESAFESTEGGDYVALLQPKSAGEISWRLYDTSYFPSDR